MNHQRILSREISKYEGQEVKIAGWVQNIRTHGQIIFIDLRDRTGLTQVIFTPSFIETGEKIRAIRSEWVLQIEGQVKKRPQNMINPEIESGDFEVEAKSLIVFSKAKTLPFSIETSGEEISEELRLQYRYLDLRRKRLSLNLKKRHQVLQFFRNYLSQEGFTEVETPILTKSTPEGARDFLVPSRFLAGQFYALPQSPQQYKQLLMVAGLERYFQIARCFRDEDSRANRQAEFTQLDIETSFASREEIMTVVEKLAIQTVNHLFPEKKLSQNPFPVMTYQEAMEKYQSDKPDIRKNKNDNQELAFLWVVDFPMFLWSENHKRWEASHHPFTRPKEEEVDKIKNEPEKIGSFQYDLVLNGEEVAGGSLRSYKREILEAVFEAMGHQKKEIELKFGHLLNSFEYGVPPHGGIAFGFDRFLSILLQEENIREVIAFPKMGESRDLMMNAPSVIEENQLAELHLKVLKNEKQD